ncbi:MAG TPA: alpha-glucosidase [Candidatus Fimimorpha faecalis]|uniref:Alpha-glucosidase n=1 Tax=Candidatus Fimimorpha faecalis TaxID=2840824 RepID=A0A9D1EFD2_9FIRM|nr:alpha-glucosidase [Candidatus Fimimorpha faecalis]
MKKQWWHDKVAYQIYPKSFYDSNGDGIGDVPGIIEKLDYLKNLGVDIIWISPIYVSPCADQGYDVADYCGIDPQFGTMEDVERLIAEAKKRDMYIVMDLVVNHCSDEHEWFQKAIADPDGEYGSYFYIETVKDGKLPCNWRSYFGGPVWEKLPGHEDKYYLHVFHKKQPDLNWENPKLRQKVYEMIRWWLEKGIAGFRIDAIINIKKVLPWKDYPADREDGLCNIDCMLKEAKGIGKFFAEMRDQAFLPYQAFTVGEVFNEKEEEIPDFIGDNGYFSSMFDFKETCAGKSMKGWYDCNVPSPDEYKQCCFLSQRQSENIGFFSNIIENHDEPRGVSHYLPENACNDRGKKLLAAMYFMLRGLPFIYQGQEIGMTNKQFHSIEEIDDVSSKDEYQVALNAGLTPEEAIQAVGHYSRDNARTPFQWNDGKNAGFTVGTPWLGLNENYKEINAAAQVGQEDSVFAFYQKLIALRKNPEYKETVVYGTTEPIFEEIPNVMAYFRKGSKNTLLIIGNFNAEKQTLPVQNIKKVLLNNLPDMEYNDNQLTLDSYQAVILEV